DTRGLDRPCLAVRQRLVDGGDGIRAELPERLSQRRGSVLQGDGHFVPFVGWVVAPVTVTGTAAVLCAEFIGFGPAAGSGAEVVRVDRPLLGVSGYGHGPSCPAVASAWCCCRSCSSLRRRRLVGLEPL